jgi:uncharacterized protein DUF1801
VAYEAKTKPTKVSVAAYLDAIEDPERRKDCKAIAAMMKRVTGTAGKMWGTAIVGFGSYHYKYASGHEGDSCLVGFANRKGDITLYLLGVMLDPKAKAMLKDLGKHKAGKGCLYLKRLADVDTSILETLIERSVADTKKRYAQAAK